MGIESPVHLIFIAIVALIVLGPKRLPELARSLGNGIREFRQSLETGANAPETPVHPPQAAPPTPAADAAPPASGAAPAPPEQPAATATAQAPPAEQPAQGGEQTPTG
jgi:sec-independent protein translocase protein TatA